MAQTQWSASRARQLGSDDAVWVNGGAMQGDGRRVRAAKTGAKIGAACGLAIGQAVMASNSPLGFYTGSVLLLLGSWILAGAAAGAGIGWLAADEPGSS